MDDTRSENPAILATLGDLAEDVVVWLRQPLRAATDNPATIHRCRGGSAANVAAFAASTVPSRFIGRVGSDPLGHRLTEELEQSGVDVRVQRAGRTGSIVVLVDEHGERTMLPDRGAAAELSDIPVDWLDGVGALHVPLYALATEPSARNTLTYMHTARDRGITVTMDASSVGVLDDFGPRRFIELIGRLRPAVVFANLAEAELLGLTAGPPHAGTLVVIKAGANPTTILGERGTPRRIAVPGAAPPRDTTGAGDAFAAGYLSAMLRGSSPEAAVEAGHEKAAEVLGTPGAGGRAGPHSDGREAS